MWKHKWLGNFEKEQRTSTTGYQSYFKATVLTAVLLRFAQTHTVEPQHRAGIPRP